MATQKSRFHFEFPPFNTRTKLTGDIEAESHDKRVPGWGRLTGRRISLELKNEPTTSDTTATAEQPSGSRFKLTALHWTQKDTQVILLSDLFTNPNQIESDQD
jgi:hypothetical protein